MEHLHFGLNPIYVALSFMIAIIAAFAATSIQARLKVLEGKARSTWLWAGAGIFGFGVWAMHFSGMIGYMLPVRISYDPLLVIASIFGGVGAGYVALNVVGRHQVSTVQLLLAGVAMGAGIGVMHYTGVFAMQTGTKMEFDYLMLGVSVVVAVSISTIGLWILTSRLLENSSWKQMITAMVVGSAIPFMHYVGMLAVKFASPSAAASQAQLLPFDNLLLVNAVVLAALVILSLPIVVTFDVGAETQQV